MKNSHYMYFQIRDGWLPFLFIYLLGSNFYGTKNH